MNKDTKYEFNLPSKQETAKIILARVIVFAAAIGCLLVVLFGGADFELSSRCYLAGIVATSIFVYINLVKIKLEFEEIFERTFGHQGTEFAVIGAGLATYGLYLDNFM